VVLRRAAGGALPALFSGTYAGLRSFPIPSLRLPEQPREDPNLSPKPVPKEITRAHGTGDVPLEARGLEAKPRSNHSSAAETATTSRGSSSSAPTYGC
jgi:hypothetical protein